MEPVKYYLEAHVTIEPVFDKHLEGAKFIAEQYGFRVADLLMKKRENDTEERSKHDTFMTGRSKYYKDLESRTMKLVEHLQKMGFKVWRYKIEDTLIDSRREDKFELLEKKETRP